jgi:hypothetical protein
MEPKSFRFARRSESRQHRVRAMRRKLEKAPPVDPPDYTLQSPISRPVAVRMIADRVPRHRDDDVRFVRNRVSKRLTYAIKRGKLARPTRGEFLFADIVTWAQQTWPGKLNDLPLVPVTGSIQVDLPGLEVSLTAEQLPTDLAGCQRMLGDYITKVGALEAKLRAAHAEIEQLRPDAEKWRNFKARSAPRGQY